jgi:hypothetical protein
MEITLSPDVMTKLDGAVTECVNSLVRSQAEKDFRKDVLDRLKEEIDGFKPADFNALVKERFDDSITNKVAQLEAVIELNDALNEHRRKSKTYLAPVSSADTEEQEEA